MALIWSPRREFSHLRPPRQPLLPCWTRCSTSVRCSLAPSAKLVRTPHLRTIVAWPAWRGTIVRIPRYLSDARMAFTAQTDLLPARNALLDFSVHLRTLFLKRAGLECTLPGQKLLNEAAIVACSRLESVAKNPLGHICLDNLDRYEGLEISAPLERPKDFLHDLIRTCVHQNTWYPEKTLQRHVHANIIIIAHDIAQHRGTFEGTKSALGAVSLGLRD